MAAYNDTLGDREMTRLDFTLPELELTLDGLEDGGDTSDNADS
jgi:hypothetical protein